jgi:hypothetical protein
MRNLIVLIAIFVVLYLDNVVARRQRVHPLPELVRSDGLTARDDPWPRWCGKHVSNLYRSFPSSFRGLCALSIKSAARRTPKSS